jgi:hypothetical protein
VKKELSFPLNKGSRTARDNLVDHAATESGRSRSSTP